MGKRSKRRGSSFENEDDREPLTQGQTVMTSSSSFGSLPSHARVGESVSLPTLGRALQRRVTTTFTEQKQTAQPDILPSVAESHPELFASNSKRDDAHAAGPFPATPGAAPAENVQSVREYLLAESNPKSSQPERDLLLLTERDKLYNSIIRIPYQLERMLLFGQLLCLDCFLGREGALQGHHLADILCVSVFACSAATVRSVKAGSIYYWMKDITPEFLKIHALYGALEIFNIIFANYGVSVVSALCGTCSLLLDPDTELLQRGTVSLEQSTRRWKRKRLKRLVQLAADAALMYAVITLHALVIMSQAITFSVVLNSSQNALIALLVAANFGEIKGIVYKKWDANKLEAMAIMDLTERFHLLVILLFIVVEDMQSNDSMLPTRHVLVECLRILLAEVFIDNIKHAVLTKKDNLRPGIFREFFKDMCDKYQDCQSWDAYKIVMFSPYATAVLCVRIGTTFLAIAHDNDQAASALGPLLAPSWSLSATLLLLAWFAAFLFKLALGYGLKVCANTYKRYYDCNYSKLGRHRDNKKDK